MTTTLLQRLPGVQRVSPAAGIFGDGTIGKLSRRLQALQHRGTAAPRRETPAELTGETVLGYGASWFSEFAHHELKFASPERLTIADDCKALLNHDDDQLLAVLGDGLNVYGDDYGVYVALALRDEPYHRTLFHAMRKGLVAGLSLGPVSGLWDGHNHHLHVQEVSFVLSPFQPADKTTYAMLASQAAPILAADREAAGDPALWYARGYARRDLTRLRLRFLAHDMPPPALRRWDR